MDAKRIRFLGLGLALVLVFTFGVQGARGLWERDEGRYTVIAVNMIKYGDYLHPRLNHETFHYAKPPLTYWLIAGAVNAFGYTEWAARLPNTLAFLLTLWGVYGLGRIFVPQEPSLPVIVYGASVLPLGAANYLNADTMLTCFETMGVLLIARLLWSPAHYRRVLMSGLAGAAFGLAFLVKGPPAWLPILAVAGYALTGRWGEVRSRISIPTFLLAAVLLGGSWFFVVVQQSPDLWDYFVNVEFKDRIMSDRFHRNPEWYGALKVYMPALVLGFLPWSVIVLTRCRDLATKHGRPLWPKDRQIVFLVLWFAVPLAVFFLAKSRLPLYILPCFVPLSMLTAKYLVHVVRPRTFRLVGLISVTTTLAALTFFAFYPYEHDARALARGIDRLAPAPKEVAFVFAHPAYGLAFYLGAEVKNVIPKGEGDEVDLLEQAARKADSGRLWVVPATEAGRFDDLAESAGLELHIIGTVNRFTLYRERYGSN